MSSVHIQTAETENVEVLAVDNLRQPLMGLSNLRLRVRRVSDDKFLDWGDNTFKAPASIGTLLQTLSEISDTYAPGYYRLAGGFDTSAISNPEEDDTYILTAIQEGAPQNAVNFPQTGEIKVGKYLDYIDQAISDNATPTEVRNELLTLRLDQLVTTDPGAVAPTTGSYLHQMIEKLEYLPVHTVLMSFSYNQVSDRLDAVIWVEKGNLAFNTPAEMGVAIVSLFNKNGTLLFTLQDSSPDANGVYKIEKATPGLSSDQLYYAWAQVAVSSAPGGTVSGIKGMFTL